MRVLYALQFLYSAGLNMIYRIFPAYLRGFIQSAFLISFVTTAYSAAKTLAIPLGIGADRLGHGRSVILSFLALTAIVFVLSFANDIVHYTMLFFFIGLVSRF